MQQGQLAVGVSGVRGTGPEISLSGRRPSVAEPVAPMREILGNQHLLPVTTVGVAH